MTREELLAAARKKLAAAGIQAPRREAEELLCFAEKISREEIFRAPEKKISLLTRWRFSRLFRRRERREPLAFIFGEEEFAGVLLKTDARALAPRPETELLVELAQEEIKRREGKAFVADVGTGSGAVILGIAHALTGELALAPSSRRNQKELIVKSQKLTVAQPQLAASDLSPRALSLAKENARRLGVAVDFRLGDLLTPFVKKEIDILISNPPYLSAEDLRQAAPELNFEPKEALAGGEDGLLFYRRLFQEGRGKLAPGAALFLEIGATQGAVVRRLAEENFPSAHIEVLRDFAGKNRVVAIWLSES